MKLNNKKISKLVLGGLLAAIITAATLVIQIPTPTKGYVNLGDCFVIIAGWLLGPTGGAAAAGIGSALSDLISGYAVYAPATFIIKALMAAAAAGSFAVLSRRTGSFAGRIISAVIAEVIMVAGYAGFEAVLYGSLGNALAGIPSNAVQALGGIIFSVTLYETVLKRIPAAKALSSGSTK